MATGRWMVGAVVGCTALVISGCASLEELRQVQMAQRSLEAEKAEIEQRLFDARTSMSSLRARADSLEGQLAVKDQLISNLTSENDGLEEKFRKAQSVVEKLASKPIGAVSVGTGKLPAELDAALARFAAEHPTSVAYDSENGTLRWTSDLVFAFGSDIVREDARESLRRVAEILKTPEAADFDVIVVGHTDNVPIRRPETLKKHASNTHLSAHRAIAVRKVLVQNGINADRIGVMGFGEFRPVASNDTDEGRAKNRRVEMYIVPSGTFSVGTQPTAALTFTGDAKESPTK